MSIVLDESVRGLWYCLTIPDEQDFLLALKRIAEKHYEITYRFRYYNSSDPFDEEDKKSWYQGEIKGISEEDVIAKIHDDFMPAVMNATAFINGGEFTELLRGDRSFDEFMEEFMKQDFVHTQIAH